MRIVLNNNNLKKKILFFSFLYATLIISFILNENSTGGAYKDYINQKLISIEFGKNFFETLLSYDQFSTRHSPILIIFLSFLEKISLNDYLIRFLHLNICLLLPIFFYKSLKLKYVNLKDDIIYLLTGLIFISPVFRSLAIWPDSRLLGLTFFTISIYYFIKYLETKKFKYCLFNLIFYIFASYLSPNFSLFAIFFLYKFFENFKIFSKEFILILVINFICSLPAIYYLFILDVNFLNKSAAIGVGNENNIFFTNFYNQILLISSIILFYFLPFIILKIANFEKEINYKNIVLSVLIFIICVINFNYNPNYTGGGIFYKFSDYLFNSNYFFYIFALLGIYLIIQTASISFDNFLIMLIIFISNPQITVYHKYYDPLIIIILFLLLNIKIDFDNKNSRKYFIFIYIYFSLFLITNIFKNYV